VAAQSVTSWALPTQQSKQRARIAFRGLMLHQLKALKIFDDPRGEIEWLVMRHEKRMHD